MKRKIALLMALLMALGLCACAKTVEPLPTVELPAATVTPAATAVPTPAAPTPTPEPEWEPATVRVDDCRIVWKSFDKGSTITVIGALDDWYIIEGNDADLFISQSVVRLSTAPVFEAYTAYARRGAMLYSQPDLSGEGTALYMNSELKVLDGNDNWLYIECQQGSGYISKENVSDHRIDYTGGYSSYSIPGGGESSGGSTGGGESSGGSTGGGESSGGSTGGSENGGGVDGGDISLMSMKTAAGGVQLLSSWNGPAYKPIDRVSATVLCDGTDAYLCIFNRGDIVRVTEKAEDNCILLVGELKAPIPRWQLSFADDTPYKAWEGFAQREAVLYEDYQAGKELHMFARNNRFQVLDEFKNVEMYFVEYNGQTGFMHFEDVSKTEIRDDYYSYSYSYNDGGTSGGGTSDGGTSDPNLEWTPPML